MENQNSGRGMSDALMAFGMGLLAGVAVGLIMAPASGRDTRRKLGRFAGRVRDTAMEGAEKASDFVRHPRRAFKHEEEEV